ncbi:MAG: hypothetical protein ACFB21_14390 [Opitutales bacterium]
MPAKSDLQFEIAFFEGVHGRVADYVEVIEILGGLYTRAGRIDDGLNMDRQLVRLRPDNATAHYNLGCSLALKGRSADALRALRKAISLGYDDARWLRKDPDLKPLHGNPAFERLAEELAQKQAG